jgi:hypothetical protein
MVPTLGVNRHDNPHDIASAPNPRAVLEVTPPLRSDAQRSRMRMSDATHTACTTSVLALASTARRHDGEPFALNIILQ